MRSNRLFDRTRTGRRREACPSTPTLGFTLKRGKYDIYLGTIFIATIIVVTFSAKGIEGIFYGLFLFIMNSFAANLWLKNSRSAKVCAVILLPMLLFCHFLPKKLKHEINQLKDKDEAKENKLLPLR